MNVLVVNAGSSSLKYQLLDTNSNQILGKGICERIGMDGSFIEHKKSDGTKIVKKVEITNHSTAMKYVVDALTDKKDGCITDMKEIDAIGHRVVSGGPYFVNSCLVTDDVIEKLKLCIDFAPLHTVPHLMGIEGCTNVMPNVPQVLVFDTSFHQTMPDYAYTYAISHDIAEKYHIRRYGAHGTSHKFVTKEVLKLLNKPVEDTKIITLHIGNGSSITAVKGGKVVDTSMGFTPLEGIEMGTRCGNIDPAIVTYLMKKENWTPDQASEYMNKKCGFLGVSGLSSDSRDIEDAIEKGDKRAILAYDVLEYQVKKYIGSYTAAMNGLDAMVFTAGLGENSPILRERICSNLEYFGIEIDKELNKKVWRQPNIVKLSTPNSKVDVYVIPTNEELMIAKDTEEIVNKK